MFDRCGCDALADAIEGSIAWKGEASASAIAANDGGSGRVGGGSVMSSSDSEELLLDSVTVTEAAMETAEDDFDSSLFRFLASLSIMPLFRGFGSGDAAPVPVRLISPRVKDLSGFLEAALSASRNTEPLDSALAFAVQ